MPLTRRSSAKQGPRGSTPAPTLDRDALEALAWLESGMPDDRVGYGPDAPKLTKDQCKQFAPASYVRAPAQAPRRRRSAPAK
jgi:hypothetical protein